MTRSLGTRNVFSASTIDQIPKQVAGGLMLGDPMAIAVPDLDRTDYLLILGANPVESNGSLCAAPDFPGRLKALRARGGKLVVVDPRRTRTAASADEHLFVRPGTDAYLLLGIVHTLLAEDLTKIDIEVNGLEELRRLAEEFTPQAAARVCGVPAGEIVRLARELAAAPTAAVYSRIGTCTAEFGTVAQWLVDVLNILTGNFDRPGGVMFTRTAAVELFRTGQPYTAGNWHSRVRALPEALGELPVATLADEIETPGEGQVRALITVAGNPVLSAPNGPRLDRAFRDLDFMVCVDPYLLPADPAAGAGPAVGGRDPGAADDDRLRSGGGRRPGHARRDDPRPGAPRGHRDSGLTVRGQGSGGAARRAGRRQRARADAGRHAAARPLRPVAGRPAGQPARCRPGRAGAAA
ncbi:molybdopterin-dependent oxidoreductase [Streptosporangium roseum]|uniref:molybdopterin-dependent oxidoreductase n=1 Tax=Streptosporangium roseum TaxID=2001 RepID=UPI000A8AB50A